VIRKTFLVNGLTIGSMMNIGIIFSVGSDIQCHFGSAKIVSARFIDAAAKTAWSLILVEIHPNRISQVESFSRQRTPHE
jgi:hypothetical protein